MATATPAPPSETRSALRSVLRWLGRSTSSPVGPSATLSARGDLLTRQWDRDHARAAEPTEVDHYRVTAPFNR